MHRRKRFSIKLAAALFMITSRCYEAVLEASRTRPGGR